MAKNEDLVEGAGAPGNGSSNSTCASSHKRSLEGRQVPFPASHTTYLDIQVKTFLNQISIHKAYKGFPGGSEVQASASNMGDPGSIPGSGKSPGEGNGNPLRYSCLENPMEGGAW